MATALVVSPEEALEKDEKYNEIRRAIADLPQTWRDTFVLHFYKERTHQEIVQEQGISYDTVCKRISQARKRLKEKLSGYFLGEEGELGAKESARWSSSPTPPSRGKEQGPQEADVPTVKETARETAALEIVEMVVEERTKITMDSPEPKEPQSENVGEQLQGSEAPVLLATSTVTANGSARSQSPTPPARGEKQKTRPDRSKARNTGTLSAARECAPVVVSPAEGLRERLPSPQVVKEKPFVDGAIASYWSSWRENFIANVSGELPLWSRRPVVLPTATLDEKFRETGGAIAPLLERLREAFVGHFYEERTQTEKAEQHSWIAHAMVDKAGFVADFDTG